METLENSERHWPARRKHMFFQIFMAQHICRDAVEIHWANGNIQVIRPVRGISINGEAQGGIRPPYGTVAKLAMRQPFVLFKGLTFQKLCLPGAFRPGDHHNKMLRPGLCVVHASPQYL